MKKIVKEVINERYEEGIDSGLFIDDDGWDKEALEDVGLINWLSDVQRLQYEVLNARRGSYAIHGDSANDLLNEIVRLQESLNDIVSDIEHQISRAH